MWMREDREKQYANLETTNTGENIYQDLQMITPDTTSNTAPSKVKSSFYKFWIIGGLATGLACLALMGIIITAGVCFSVLQENTVRLTRRIEQLENQLNPTQDNQRESIVLPGQLQSSLENINTQLSSLQSSVDSLTTRVNSPVNLYQNCIQETRSCTMSSHSSYSSGCFTPTLPNNVTVSIIHLMTHTSSCWKYIYNMVCTKS